MKFILRTCALFLILPMKLKCETTFRQSGTKATTIGADNLTTFFPKDTEQPSKPNDETTYSPNSSIGLKGTITDHEATVSAEEPITFFTKHYLKLNDKTIYNPSNTWLPKHTTKDKTIIRADEYTTLETPSQTPEHRDDTSLSHAITGTSSSHLSSTELTQKETFTPQTQDMSKEVITTSDQTFSHFKSTNNVQDKSTQGNQTTRSVDTDVSTETNITTNFAETPEVITTQSRIKVHTTESLTTKWSSSTQERDSMQLPILNTTDPNASLDIGNEERNDTATSSLNTSTTSAFFTRLGLTVHTEGDASTLTDTMDQTTTYETTTQRTSRKIKSPNPNIETTPTSQTDNTETTISKFPVKDKNNNKSHPGPVIASLIGSILFLMFVACAVVLLRNHQMRKKKSENTDWAGPSPFIESDIQPNPSAINEEGPFYRRESKKISLHSFLPQRLSKRLSMLSPMDEEVSIDEIPTSSTFGRSEVQPTNDTATMDQFQTKKANGSPEVSTDSSVPENISIPLTPENDNTQSATKSEEEIISSPPGETNSVTSTPFEDVDLNISLDKNSESISPDSLQCPSAPPLPPSWSNGKTTS